MWVNPESSKYLYSFQMEAINLVKKAGANFPHLFNSCAFPFILTLENFIYEFLFVLTESSFPDVDYKDGDITLAHAGNELSARMKIDYNSRIVIDYLPIPCIYNTRVTGLDHSYCDNEGYRDERKALYTNGWLKQ